MHAFLYTLMNAFLYNLMNAFWYILINAFWYILMNTFWYILMNIFWYVLINVFWYNIMNAIWYNLINERKHFGVIECMQNYRKNSKRIVYKIVKVTQSFLSFRKLSPCKRYQTIACIMFFVSPGNKWIPESVPSLTSDTGAVVVAVPSLGISIGRRVSPGSRRLDSNSDNCSNCHEKFTWNKLFKV